MIPTFFTSDEHYGHRNVIGFCKRPFRDMWEMREELIARHNAKVPRGGLTYHLGDIFWRTMDVDEAHGILDRLNGKHAFVWGNHDELLEDTSALRERFIWTKDIAYIHPIKSMKKIVLCHYSMRVWRGSHNGAWHLYGHSHGDLPTHGKSFDVGVDANNYEPVSIDEVAEWMERNNHVHPNHPPCRHCGLCLDCLRKERAREDGIEGGCIPRSGADADVPGLPEAVTKQAEESGVQE